MSRLGISENKCEGCSILTAFRLKIPAIHQLAMHNLRYARRARVIVDPHLSKNTAVMLCGSHPNVKTGLISKS